jgi:hypothetical protein
MDNHHSTAPHRRCELQPDPIDDAKPDADLDARMDAAVDTDGNGQRWSESDGDPQFDGLLEPESGFDCD